MDPKKKQKARSKAQAEVRRLVDREVTPVIQAHRGPATPVEEAFVRAIYAPDRRLG